MTINQTYIIEKFIVNSWAKIAPLWPIKNSVAVNPLLGFIDLTFEEALKHANTYFQEKNIPEKMKLVNCQTIKWLQVFFDEGQATIKMPMRNFGFLKSMLILIKFDKELHGNNNKKLYWIKNLSENPKIIITETLSYLGIDVNEQEEFLTLMLTTLHGWASYIQYLTNWANINNSQNIYHVTQSEYLAFRLILVCLIWEDAGQLLMWHKNAIKHLDIGNIYEKILDNESLYQTKLLKKLEDSTKLEDIIEKSSAQIVFCIDVRSEPFRRALEAQGNYETYGFAGFFGLDIYIKNILTNTSYASCPVLLNPTHNITHGFGPFHLFYKNKFEKLQIIKKLYQSMIYGFMTPFVFINIVAIPNALLMAIKNFIPRILSSILLILKKIILPDNLLNVDVQNITLEKKVAYGAKLLKMIGLTKNFAPLVIFCGHGGAAENNVNVTTFHCAACGANRGGINAQILATILNLKDVRHELSKQDIKIPEHTLFLGAEHNTTTDDVQFYYNEHSQIFDTKIASLKKDFEKAKNQNNLCRIKELDKKFNDKLAQITALHAVDWSEIRPEWGCARNASFIIGPRWLTKSINLEGRSFLHSYEWKNDLDASYLNAIFNRTMVVAQWINAQYLFSTIDNTAFGSGNKITQNITGKMGIMQGNASDIMNGLPLQLVYKSEEEPYHNLLRLKIIVYAPKSHIDLILNEKNISRKLLRNGWVNLISYSPDSQEKFALERDLTWNKLH